MIDVTLSCLKRRYILGHLLLFACDLLNGTPNDDEIAHCGLELLLYLTKNVDPHLRGSQLSDSHCLI